MANITHIDPFNELNRFNPFGDDFFNRFALRPIVPRFEEGELQMPLDVTEDDKAYTVKAEIPGVNKEDIKISIDGNQVYIGAEIKKETEQKEGSKVIRSERYYGSVSRSFSLAEDIDEGGAQARYEKGVLELVLPKKPGTGAKQLIVS